MKEERLYEERFGISCDHAHPRVPVVGLHSGFNSRLD
jgi:hypothetical protein